MTDYLTLAIGSPRRLAILKRAADKLNTGHNYRKASGNLSPYTWRDMRYCSFANVRAAACQLSPGLMNGAGPVYWYSHSGPEFPREQYADEVVNLDHTGWLSDAGSHEKVRGLVVALPHGRFLAGYHWSDNGERVYFSDIYDCQHDAARAADGHAETFAETCREDDYQYERARNLEYEIDGNFSRLRELIASIKEAREKLRTQYADYI